MPAGLDAPAAGGAGAGTLGTAAARLLGARRPPTPIAAAAVLVGAAAVLPAAYLFIVVAGDLGSALDTALTSRTAGIVARTLGLTAAVALSAIAIALPIGWLTVRTDLPGRRVWAVLCTLPIVIPSYVGAYLFVAALGPSGLAADVFGAGTVPSIYGFWGTWIVLTLFTYPLVLIPLRATLARLDPDLEDAARGLGRSPAAVFRTVVLPQLWPVLGAGGLLVALYVLSDFGAVSILRFDSFTREIYVAYRSGFDRTAAAALGAVLIIIMALLLILSLRLRGAKVVHRLGPGTARPARAHKLGRWRWPALAICSLVVALGFVIPVGVLVYWATEGITGSGFDPERVAALGANSVLVSAPAAAVGAIAALAVATLSVRYPSLLARLTERAAHAGYALPGILVALALVFFSTRLVSPLYQTTALLVFALTVHYLPLAVGPAASSLIQVSPRIEEAARVMGRSQGQIFTTITIPLARGGLLAGAALIFLHAMKELPATLVLSPIGFNTLATDIWNQTTFGFYEASALPALVLLVLAAVPVYLLTERGAAIR